MRDLKLGYIGRATPPAAPTVPPVPYTLQDGWNARDIEHFTPSAHWTATNRLHTSDRPKQHVLPYILSRLGRGCGNVYIGAITPPPRHWRLILLPLS